MDNSICKLPSMFAMNITFMYEFNNEVYHYIDSNLMLKVKYKWAENIGDTSFPFFFVKVK